MNKIELNRDRIYKELLVFAIAKDYINPLYEKNMKGVVDDVLLKLKGMPRSVIKRRVDKALNTYAQTLYVENKIAIPYEEKVRYLDAFIVSPALRKEVLDGAEYTEDEEEDDYDKLRLFEEDEALGIIKHLDGRQAFNDYKTHLAQKGRTLEIKHQQKQSQTTKNRNRPKPNLGK
jgi:hypothetical protein